MLASARKQPRLPLLGLEAEQRLPEEIPGFCPSSAKGHTRFLPGADSLEGAIDQRRSPLGSSRLLGVPGLSIRTSGALREREEGLNSS